MNGHLRIVLVGCGGISSSWFEGMKTVPDISLVGLVDLQKESAERRKAEYNLTEAHVGTDVAEMLKAVKPDVVFDCTVPVARASVVRTALEHGCHVLSEKPMANSMAEAHELMALANKSGRTFAIMQNRRYDARIRALRSFLDAGSVGDLTTLSGDFYIGAHFGGFREQMKHVLLLDMAIHSFDQARLISGADPEAVYCREWNPRGSWYGQDASAIAIFEMSNGIVYNYRGSWCAEGLNTSWECDWRALGSTGSVVWDGANAFRAQAKNGDEGFTRPMKDLTVTVPESTAPKGHGGCIHDFIQCLRTGQTPETICTDNIKSLAMVFGAIESSQTGQRVSIKFKPL
jgi:predicted dehydrogenase